MTTAQRFKALLTSRKKGNLTNRIYELLYIHSNRFIAHFNRDGFYNARIKDDEGYKITIQLLSSLKPKSDNTKENREVNALIQVAKEFKKQE